MNRHHPTGATAHMSAAVSIPTVHPIQGYPGMYSLRWHKQWPVDESALMIAEWRAQRESVTA